MLSEGGRLVQRLRDTGAELQFFPAAVKNPLRLLWNAHRIADIVRPRRRRPGPRPQPRARVERTHGGAAHRRAVRHHLPWRLLARTSDAKRLYNSVMARGDAVIANSHYTADLIRMRYGTPRDAAARHLSRRRRAASSIR